MPILESIHNKLQIAGMSTNHSIQKYPFNARNLTSLFIYVLNIICNVGFLISGKAKNLMEFTDSMYITITVICATLIFINLNWKMHQLFEFFNRLENTVDQRLVNQVSTTTIYSEASVKVQKVVKISTFALPTMTPICLVLPKFIASLITYFTTDLGADALELPLPMWFPFDVGNPVGYSIAAFVEYIFTFNVDFYVMCILIIAIGPCLILISMSEDMKCSLNTLDKSAKMKDSQLKIVQQFNEFIQFHSNAKQLVDAYSKIMEIIFAIIFSWTIESICSTMLVIQIELHRGITNSVLVQRCNQVFTAFLMIFVCCDFGHKLSKSFEEIDNFIGKLHWYKFPLQIWKMLPILIAGTQEPATLRVFGSISCTREDFKNVLNSGFSYFMVIRQFE